MLSTAWRELVLRMQWHLKVRLKSDRTLALAAVWLYTQPLRKGTGHPITTLCLTATLTYHNQNRTIAKKGMN